MKIINPNNVALVILNWIEFEGILQALPERELIKMLVNIGSGKENEFKELTKPALISKIYIEYEEQAY